MTFPPLARVRQSIPQPKVEDVPGTVRRLIQSSRLRERVKPGGTIAVGIGSRGIHGIAVVARAIVESLQEMRYQPFVVAAIMLPLASYWYAVLPTWVYSFMLLEV